MPECDFCGGTGRIDVLDVWEIQRSYIEAERKPYFESAEALPILDLSTACPKCCGVEAADEDMRRILVERGDPWNPKTYQKH